MIALNTWTADDLDLIASTDDLHVAPFRADGRTRGTLTWVWSVAVDGELDARADHGLRSRWYRAAVDQSGGMITAAGGRWDVVFTAGQSQRRR